MASFSRRKMGLYYLYNSYLRLKMASPFEGIDALTVQIFFKGGGREGEGREREEERREGEWKMRGREGTEGH